MRWAVILGSALVLAGCGGSSKNAADGTTGATTNPLSQPASKDVPHVGDNELRFLEGLGRWRAHVGETAIAILDAKTSAAAVPKAKGFRDCTARLRKLGHAPTGQLSSAKAEFLDACTSLERLAHAKRATFAGAARLAFGEAEIHLQRGEESVLWRSEGRTLPSSGLAAGHGASLVKSHVDITFSRAASQTIGKRILVRCFDEHDWYAAIQEMSAYTNGATSLNDLGFAHANSRSVNLAPKICESIEHLAYGLERPAGQKKRLELALAVHVLAHESGHAAGITNEAEAECFSVQRVAATAQRLQVEKPYAHTLQQTYWRVGYPKNLPAYKSRECRNGGRFDLHPRDAAFP